MASSDSSSSSEGEKTEEAPIEVFAREAERVGYAGLDARSLLYGYCLGREWPPPPGRVRELAEQLLSDRRGPHLPRPGDAVESPSAAGRSAARLSGSA